MKAITINKQYRKYQEISDLFLHQPYFSFGIFYFHLLHFDKYENK